MNITAKVKFNYLFTDYYTSNNQQLNTPNLSANAPGARSNPTTLVGPQGNPVTPTAPAATIPPQASTHMHQTMPGTCYIRVYIVYIYIYISGYVSTCRLFAVCLIA